jgi:hypothetical protein
MPDTQLPPRRFAVVHPPDSLAAQNARLTERVRELEHLLQVERARNKGLERGLSALSERAATLRKKAQPLPAGPTHPAV